MDVPHVVFLSDVWLLDDVLLFGQAEDERGGDTTALPDELYLRRFLPLDVSDGEAVRAFCAEYGVVGTRDMSDFPLGGLHSASLIIKERAPELTAEVSSLDFESTATAPLGQALARIAASDKEWFDDVFSQRGISPPPAAVYDARTLAQVAAYQAVLRYALRIWLHVSGQRTIAVPDGGRGAEMGVPWLGKTGIPLGPDGPWLLGEILNPALTPFHVHLTPVSPPITLRPPNVYQAMCLQLANHIAENAPFRRCDECGGIFGRKQDRRYTKGQRRLQGRRFCSDTCEDRWHQREHRRRQREKGAKP